MKWMIERAARRAPLVAALLLAAGLSIPAAQAATVTWTGSAGNGLWFDAGNWSGGAGVPGPLDDAVFGIPASGTVSLGGATASVASVSLDGADGLELSNGTLQTPAFTQTGGTNDVSVSLLTTTITINSAAHLRVTNNGTASAETLTGFGIPTQARISVLSNSLVSATTLDLVNVRVDVDGSGGQLRFTSAQAQAFVEFYLTNGGVLGCIGSSAVLDALAGASVATNIGNGGQPGRMDCNSFTFNQGINATVGITLFHNQNGYRLERPNGAALSLNGAMRLSTANAVRTVLPGVHAYSGPTLVGNGAALELVGELGGSDVTVQAGASLRGNGRVHGNVDVAANAALRPGTEDNTQPGTLRFGSLGLVDLSLLQFDLAEPGTVGAPNDLLIVDGDATLGGGRVDIATLGETGRYRLLTVGGTPSGSLVLQSLPAGQNLADWQLANAGGAIDLVPPGTLQIDPASLLLNAPEGSQDEGSVTLSNVGGSDINVTQIDPPSSASFIRQGGTCAAGAFAIPPDASCTVIYRFTSTQPGSFSNEILVRSFPQAAGATSFTLDGTATRLPATLGPALLDFGIVGVDASSAPEQASLFNPSSLALAVTDISLDAGLEFDITGSSCGASLASKASCTVSLVFQPLAAGAASDVLRVATEDGELSVDLAGEGFSLQIFSNGFEN